MAFEHDLKKSDLSDYFDHIDRIKAADNLISTHLDKHIFSSVDYIQNIDVQVKQLMTLITSNKVEESEKIQHFKKLSLISTFNSSWEVIYTQC